MTTCPVCKRVEATVRQHDDVVDGALVDIKLCWSTWMLDRFCDKLGEDLQTKADEEAGALARQLPGGLSVLREVVCVLTYGGAARCVGPGETGGGQTAEDHAAHAFLHAMNADRDVANRDHETGALDLVHAICRAWLAAAMVDGK